MTDGEYRSAMTTPMRSHCYSVIDVPSDLASRQQCVDDVVMYGDGKVLLENKVFAYGVPIDRFDFGAGFIAKRRIDCPNYLWIVRPDKELLLFEFRPYRGLWFHWVPLVD